MSDPIGSVGRTAVVSCAGGLESSAFLERSCDLAVFATLPLGAGQELKRAASSRKASTLWVAGRAMAVQRLKLMPTYCNVVWAPNLTLWS